MFVSTYIFMICFIHTDAYLMKLISINKSIAKQAAIDQVFLLNSNT